jgi:hypothetical protein
MALRRAGLRYDMILSKKLFRIDISTMRFIENKIEQTRY